VGLPRLVSATVQPRTSVTGGRGQYALGGAGGEQPGPLSASLQHGLGPGGPNNCLHWRAGGLQPWQHQTTPTARAHVSGGSRLAGWWASTWAPSATPISRGTVIGGPEQQVRWRAGGRQRGPHHQHLTRARSPASLVGGAGGLQQRRHHGQLLGYPDLRATMVGVGGGNTTGVTGALTATLQQQANFTNAGWDFVTVWNNHRKTETTLLSLPDRGRPAIQRALHQQPAIRWAERSSWSRR